MAIALLLLLSLGIVVIYTSSPLLAFAQLVFGFIGFLFYFLLYIFDYKTLRPIVKYLYITVVILLLITWILGIETRGSIRWIPLGLFNLQPSEFAKPVLILALASFWSRNQACWSNIGKSVAILLPILILIFRQPDLGTTMTVLFIWVGLLIAANISTIKILIMGMGASLFAPLVWFLLQDYQKQRIISFLSPNQDPKGLGFHVIQSTIAVGSGQLLGRGLGRGTQSRLQFLPEFRTDFIFAFISEELGLLGAFIVLSLYSIIFFLCFKVLSNIDDRFGELIVVGVISMLFPQIVINIGMNIGLVPITGITLPLLSYGGSSVVATLLSAGLVSSVAKFGVKRREVDTFNL